MTIKNIAIETARRCPQAIVHGLHPGTVDSQLSQPFQARVPAEKLFNPDYAAQQLLRVIEQRQAHDRRKCYAWDGQEIPP